MKRKVFLFGSLRNIAVVVKLWRANIIASNGDKCQICMSGILEVIAHEFEFVELYNMHGIFQKENSCIFEENFKNLKFTMRKFVLGHLA